jgi:hypothetical protein
MVLTSTKRGLKYEATFRAALSSVLFCGAVEVKVSEMKCRSMADGFVAVEWTALFSCSLLHGRNP